MKLMTRTRMDYFPIKCSAHQVGVVIGVTFRLLLNLICHGFCLFAKNKKWRNAHGAGEDLESKVHLLPRHRAWIIVEMFTWIYLFIRDSRSCIIYDGTLLHFDDKTEAQVSSYLWRIFIRQQKYARKLKKKKNTKTTSRFPYHKLFMFRTSAKVKSH